MRTAQRQSSSPNPVLQATSASSAPKFKPWTSKDPHRFTIPKPAKNHWEVAYGKAEKWDVEQCRGWKEEIDKLLIFTGLFSAMVTGFLIDAYKLLQDPMDTNTMILARISNQMANQTQTPALELEPFKPTAASVRINIFWFCSLVISLNVVVIGVLCMQWIREYERDLTNQSAKEAMALRQLRMEAFYAWKVPDIVNSLPILLQAAVVLFVIGLYEFLRQINRTVDIATLVPISLGLAFLLFTTILPSVQWSLLHLGFWHEFIGLRGFGIYKLPGNFWEYESAVLSQLLDIPYCAYKSPQGWLAQKLTKFFWQHLGNRILGLISGIFYSVIALIGKLFGASALVEAYEIILLPFLLAVIPNKIFYDDEDYLSLQPLTSWVEADRLRRRTRQKRAGPMESDSALARSIDWFRKTLCQSELNFQVLYHCFSDMDAATTMEAARALPDEAARALDTNGPGVKDLGKIRDWGHLRLFCWGASHDLVRPLFPLFERYVRLTNSGHNLETRSWRWMIHEMVEEPFDSRDKLLLLLQLAQGPLALNILKDSKTSEYWQLAIKLRKLLEGSILQGKEQIYQDGLRNFMRLREAPHQVFQSASLVIIMFLEGLIEFAESIPTALYDPDYLAVARESVMRCRSRTIPTDGLERLRLQNAIERMESVLPPAIIRPETSADGASRTGLLSTVDNHLGAADSGPWRAVELRQVATIEEDITEESRI